MPASARQLTINLVKQDSFSQTAIGQVMLWALSIGRYVVVFTELIVILSFLSRFKLDRDLTDINAQVASQKAIVLSYGDLESRFRQIQSQLEFLSLQTPIVKPSDTLTILEATLPLNVRIEQLGISQDAFRLSGVALSEASLIKFLNALNTRPEISSVIVGSVSADSLGTGLTFELQVKY